MIPSHVSEQARLRWSVCASSAIKGRDCCEGSDIVFVVAQSRRCGSRKPPCLLRFRCTKALKEVLEPGAILREPLLLDEEIAGEPKTPPEPDPLRECAAVAWMGSWTHQADTETMIMITIVSCQQFGLMRFIGFMMISVAQGIQLNSREPTLAQCTCCQGGQWYTNRRICSLPELE